MTDCRNGLAGAGDAGHERSGRTGRTGCRAGAAWSRGGVAGLVLAGLLLGWIGGATPARAVTEARTLERAFSLAPRRPLLAHIRFCHLYEGQCDIHPDRRDPNLTAQDHLAHAQRVNLAVNRAITPKEDVGFDSWDIHVTEGDCEDYALQKRADLIALGWPTDHLRIAVARTSHGAPHAVLVARIGATDYVLDNLTGKVLPWDRTGHRFLKLQDRDDPRAWHDLVPHQRGAAGS